MGERFPLSLSAVNVVCFKLDWDEKALKVLLIKRNITPHKNKWSLPGGFVQENEKLEEAAVRIFAKETGIAPNYINQFRTYSDTGRDKRPVNEEKVRVITTSFIAIYTSSEEPVLTEESSDYEWFKVPVSYTHLTLPTICSV